ncbi:MAG: GMC family oxidoreductase, partial [Gemmatimonadaceae bacterium]
MIIDAQSLPDGSSIEADFCVIGGGMVALALVRELASSGASIVILESGGEALVRATQDLYIGTGTLQGPVGPAIDISDYLHQSRVRYFGGSGNVWGGKCGVLERVDFDRRAWMPNSGWPFGRDVLDPYYDRACDLLEIPHLTQDMEQLASAQRPVLRVGDGKTLTTEARHHTQFTGARGTRYNELKRAVTEPPNVKVYLNANVTSLNLTSTGDHLSDLTV